MQYKLRMCGIKIDGPGNIFFDNEAIYRSSKYYGSQLKRKNQSISPHRVHESYAAGILIPQKFNSN